MLLVAAGLLWTAARLFEGRAPRPHLALIGGLVWLLACALPAFRDSLGARVVLACVVYGGYMLAAAGELWRGRDEPLLSRWPAIALLVLHGTVILARIPLVVLKLRPAGSVPEASA